MSEMVVVEFWYKETPYKALVDCKQTKRGREYRITVMNGELEKLLYGNHIVTEENGRLRKVAVIPGNEVSALKAAITEAIRHFIAPQYS